MNRFSLLLFLLVAVLLTAETKSQNSYPVKRGFRPVIALDKVPESAFESGRVLIKFKAEAADRIEAAPVMEKSEGNLFFGIDEVDKLNKQFRIKRATQHFYSPALKNTFSERHKAWGFHLWYELEFDATTTDVKTIVNSYSKINELEIVEPVYKKQLISAGNPVIAEEVEDKNTDNKSTTWTPNDPRFAEQWHYHNTGQQSGTADKDIDLPEAWEIEKGNSDVIVAIIDGGIQTDHPDLTGNMWSGIGYNFVNSSSTIVPHNHGTHVAGTVSAVNNNGVGVSGVAGGSGTSDGVRLMSCQVFTNSSSGGFHLAPVYAADNGAAISQNSWGYTSVGVYEQNVLDAIDYFNINGGGTAMDGGLTIFAAGNDDASGLWYPGCYASCLSVAATNNNDAKSWYSNYDTWVDISAPGGETNTVTARGVLSTLTGSTYGFYQGTSMACPHTTGVAALIVSNAFGLLEAGDVRDILVSTTDNHYAQNPSYIGKLGSGRLNAYEALAATQAYLTGVLNPATFSASSVSTNQINLSWTKNNQNHDVMILWSPNGTFGSPTSGTNYSIGQTLAGGGTVLYKGSNNNYSHTGLNESTSYFYKAYSYDGTWQYSAGKTAQATTFCGAFGLPVNESFASPSLPNCWEITDLIGAGQTWQIGTITGYTPNPSLIGDYAYINSDDYGSGNSQNTDLLSPVLDLTSYTNVNLSFSHYFRQYLSASTASLYYSVNGGTSWTLIQSWTASTVNPESFNQTIAALAGQSQVRFRWNFIGTYAYYWAVDNISITGTSSGATLSVSPSNRDVTAPSGSTTFDVTSNTNWTAVSNQSWCTVTPSGSSNGTITANYTENTTASPRVATITVSATGVSNVNVTVTQEAANLPVDPQIFTLTGGGSYCSASLPSGISATLSGSENGVSYQLLRNGSAEGSAVSGTGNALVWNDLTEGSYTVTATNASATVNMNGTAIVASEQPSAVAVSITADQSSVCQGSLMTFTALPVNGGSNPAFAWTVNGQAAGSNNSSFSFTPANGDVVAVSMSSSLGCVSGNPAASNSIQAVVSPMIQASVEISSNLNGVCQGTQVLFTAVPVNGGSNPFFQWLVNGVAAGSNSSSFSYTPANGDLVSVTLTSVAECLLQNPVSSDALAMSVTPSATVLVSVLPDANPVCAGTLVSFSASASNAGSNPVYQWMVNGLAAGSNLPSFAYVPANGDIVEVFLSSDVPCSLNNPAQSNMVVMQVISMAPASVSLTSSQTSLCLGQSALLTATPVNGGSNPAFAWTVNGQAAGSDNGSFSFVPANGDMVQVAMTSSLSCVSGSPALSNQIAFAVTAPSVDVLASPAEAGSVAYSGSVALNASVHLTAVANPGWNFVNWTDQLGAVVSEQASFDFMVQDCQNVLTAHFSAGNSIAGKLLFFNPLESVVPSPYNGGAFYVQLFDGLQPVGEAVMVNQGEPFVFNGLLAQKQYSLRIWDQPAANLNANAWTWNNWGGVSALDALIVNYMTTENPVVQNFPWIASAAAPQNTPFAFELADANASNSLTALDALLLMYRSVGYPGTSPFPGGKHNFTAFAAQSNNLSLPTYPQAPQIAFQRFGSYTPNSPASAVYQQATLPLTNVGQNLFKVFLTPTGDVNASFVPENGAKSNSIVDNSQLIGIEKDKPFRLPVILQQDVNLGAFNLNFYFDNDLVDIRNISNFPIHHINEETSSINIAFMDENGIGLLTGDTLLVIEAVLKKEIVGINNILSLAPGTEWADAQANEIQAMRVQWPSIKNTDASSPMFDLSFSPNPMQQNAKFRFFSSTSETIRLEVFNARGLLVFVKTLVIPAGGSDYQLSKENLGSSGVYTYRVTSTTSTFIEAKTGKIVIW